uniref:Neurotransmitter-gated ion-channel ligand-binding domain-containing protein n=1 Tax=Plectus sambesii TaxID=2011161 RepID=A0A914V803_9BILA
MNGARESIEVHVDYEITWIDEHLTWHPSDFADPVKSLVVPQSDIWQPDITLYELLESAPLIPEEKLKARVDFDGRVTVYNPQIMTLSCTMEIDLFPFDSQKCRMAFGPWVYELNEVAIDENNSTIADMTMIRGNTEWSIVTFEAATVSYTQPTGNYTVLYYFLTIKRNPVYYICVLIVPTLIITTLCLLGIFAPSSSSGEREEKVNLGLTTLLTVAVILSLVAEEMPKATSLPLLGM